LKKRSAFFFSWGVPNVANDGTEGETRIVSTGMVAEGLHTGCCGKPAGFWGKEKGKGKKANKKVNDGEDK
jgi:hypothetical protein